MKRTLVIATVVASAAMLAGCKDDAPQQPPAPADTPPATAPATQSAGMPDPDDHDHADDAAGDHPNRISLGTKTVAGLRLDATQDEPVKAGGEGAFDLVITGSKPKAVRFWVGTEDGKGSVKARAEEETPDNWHTHVEVPDPLPPGSKFCAEVEPATGEKFTVSFDLK